MHVNCKTGDGEQNRFPDCTGRQSGKHKPVAAIRIELTTYLNQVLWELGLECGLEKAKVASHILNGCVKLKKWRLFASGGTSQQAPADSGVVRGRLRRAKDPEPQLRCIDVLLNDKTLRLLEQLSRPKRGCVTTSEAAALILVEATVRSVEGARIALDELYLDRVRVMKDNLDPQTLK